MFDRTEDMGLPLAVRGAADVTSCFPLSIWERPVEGPIHVQTDGILTSPLVGAVASIPTMKL